MKEKYKISDRDYFIDKFRNFINEDVSRPEEHEIQQYTEKLRQLRQEMKKDVYPYQEKNVQTKLDKYFQDAIMSLYNLADFIREKVD